MKELSSIKRTDNCWNQFWIEYVVWDVFMHFCFLSLFLTQPTTENLWITKLAREKKLYPRNTHEKNFWTHKMPTRKILDPRNTPDKKFWTNKIPTRKNNWTHKIPTRKKIGPTKYSRKRISDPRDPRWHTIL